MSYNDDALTEMVAQPREERYQLCEWCGKPKSQDDLEMAKYDPLEPGGMCCHKCIKDYNLQVVEVYKPTSKVTTNVADKVTKRRLKRKTKITYRIPSAKELSQL